MAAPVKPSEIKALIINASDPPCTQWKKLLKVIYLWYKQKNYENDEGGGVGSRYAQDICVEITANCPTIVTTPTTTT